MLTTSLLFAPLLALLATSTPTTLHRRAGGPIAKPLPANCAAVDAIEGTTDVSGQQPSSAFVNANQVYAYYLAQDVADDDALAEQLRLCVEQCNGYGEGGAGKGCAGVFFAHNAPLPVGQYGVPGTLMQACVMFGVPVTEDDLVDAAENRYTRARAKNIECS